MHEMSLCESILLTLEDNSEKQDYTKVKKVWLEIGKLSGVEIESMRFCFDVVVKDSIADNAVLKIIETPGQAWCMACSKNVAVNELFAACPDCGSYQLQVTGGKEMKIKQLEVE